MEPKQGYSGPVPRAVRNFPNGVPTINSGRTAIAPSNIAGNTQITPQNAIAPQPSPLGGNRSNVGGLKRYFGRDITNFEEVGTAATQAGDNKSHFKSSNRENTAGSQPKKSRPSPIAFFKGIFENQKHKLLKRRDTLMTDPDDTPADLPCNRRLHHSRERSVASQMNQQGQQTSTQEAGVYPSAGVQHTNNSVVLSKPGMRLLSHQPNNSEIPGIGCAKPDPCKQQIMPLVRSRRRDSKELPTTTHFPAGIPRGEIGASHNQLAHNFMPPNSIAPVHGASSENVAGDYLSKLKKQSSMQTNELGGSQHGAFNTDHGYPTLQGLNSTRGQGTKISGLICSSIQALSKKSGNKNSGVCIQEGVQPSEMRKIPQYPGAVYPHNRASFLSTATNQESAGGDLLPKPESKPQVVPEVQQATVGSQAQPNLVRSNSSIASKARRSFLNPKFKHLCLQIESGAAPTDVMLEEAINPNHDQHGAGGANSETNMQHGQQGDKTHCSSQMMQEPLPSPDGNKPSLMKQEVMRARSPVTPASRASGLDLPAIWNHLLVHEKRNTCLKEYFTKHTSLTENMRKILVDWLVDVHRKFKLRLETLFMAINLVDRYMDSATEPMQKNKFQLFGVTCLFIASKYEEIYPPSLSDFVYVCADTYTADMLLEMEGLVLNQLGFNLVYSSSLQILGVYGQQRKLNDREKNLVLYMLTLCLLDYKICSWVWDNLRVAASLFLAAKILHKPVDAEEIGADFCLSSESIKSVALQFMMMLGTEEKEDRLTAVKRMYAHSQYGYISNLKISLRPQASPSHKVSQVG